MRIFLVVFRVSTSFRVRDYPHGQWLIKKFASYYYPTSIRPSFVFHSFERALFQTAQQDYLNRNALFSTSFYSLYIQTVNNSKAFTVASLSFSLNKTLWIHEYNAKRKGINCEYTHKKNDHHNKQYSLHWFRGFEYIHLKKMVIN